MTHNNTLLQKKYSKLSETYTALPRKNKSKKEKKEIKPTEIHETMNNKYAS